ncbi:hypothetical protein ACWIVU_00370 [Ursidibacter arcticus]
MAYRQIYAAYRDDENVADGTAEELARKLGVKPKTIRKWATPSYHKRNKGQRLIVVRLEREEV